MEKRNSASCTVYTIMWFLALTIPTELEVNTIYIIHHKIYTEFTL